MTTPTDPADVLTRLEELHNAATPGEWRWDPDYGTKGDTGLALTNEAGDEIVGAYNTHCCAFRDDPDVNDADAAAIVAEHNAMPALLAAVRGVLALADGLDSMSDPYSGRAAYRIRSVVAAALGETDGGR